jgi:transcriptional regulator with XRE-family HTH domain
MRSRIFTAMARATTNQSDRLAGDVLRLARTKSCLTQAQLAERAGVAQSLISAYENGRRQPTVPTLDRLLGAAGYELRTWLEAKR